MPKLYLKYGLRTLCIQEHLTAFFHPRAVIEIAGIELLEQELVPGVTALVHRTRRRSLSLPLGLRLSLPM